MMLALVLAAALHAPPVPTTFVTDNAHALSSSAAQQLETELHDFQSKTGDQVLLYIDQSIGNESLETWTVNAAQAWRVGKKGKDNGAILFVFIKDHKLRIEVGYGLEGTLTDAASSEIIRNTIRPKMKSGDVDGALTDGIGAMLTTIEPTFATATSAPQSTSSDDGMGAIVVMLVLALVFFGLIFALIVTIVRRGKKHGDWLDSWMFVGGSGGSGYSGHGWSSGSGGGGFSGFSGGGGGFGGGGASGGW